MSLRYTLRGSLRTKCCDASYVSGVRRWEADTAGLLKAKEGPALEFKPSDEIPNRDILEWIIAFGNNFPEGGKLVLGVLEELDPGSGERRVKGFEIADAFVRKFYSRVRDRVEPIVVCEMFQATWKGEAFAIIHIEPFDANALSPYVLNTGKGPNIRTYFRDGESTVKYEGVRVMERFEIQKRRAQAFGVA